MTSNRRLIPARCTAHGGGHGFTNVIVRKLDGAIELDVHLDGSCVIVFDEDSAVELRDALTGWLG